MTEDKGLSVSQLIIEIKTPTYWYLTEEEKGKKNQPQISGIFIQLEREMSKHTEAILLFCHPTTSFTKGCCVCKSSELPLMHSSLKSTVNLTDCFLQKAQPRNPITFHVWENVWRGYMIWEFKEKFTSLCMFHPKYFSNLTSSCEKS